MTLPASGNINWNQICAEFSLNPATAVWPSSFYGKGGAPASGALSFSNFYGRSAGSAFTPMPGTYSYNDNGVTTGGSGASATVNTSGASVVWTYTISGTNAGLVSATLASGGSATGISFNLPANHTAQTARSATVTLSQGANTWTLNLTCTGDGGFL